MRQVGLSRRRSIAIAMATATLLTAGLRVVASAAESSWAPGLDFVGFIHLSDLTSAAGVQPKNARSLRTVGVDSHGDLVIYQPDNRAAYLVDPQSLQQVGVIDTKFPALGQNISLVQALNSSGDRMYLASGVQSSPCDTSILVTTCSTGPTAVAPSIQSVDTVGGREGSAYTLPADLAGTDIIALTPVDVDGASYLFALAYQDTLGDPGSPGVGSRTLDLIAMDAAKVDAGDPGALLWSYPVPSCPSTPSWSTKGAPDYLGVDPGGRFAYFACRGDVDKAEPGARVPAGAVVVDFGNAAYPRTQDATGAFATSYYPQGAGAAFSASGGDQSRGLVTLTSVGDVDKQYVFDAVHRVWTGSVLFPVTQNRNLWGSPTDPSTGRNYIVYANNATVSVQDDEVPSAQGTPLSLGDLVPTGNTAPVVDSATHELFIPGQFTHTDASSYPSDDAIAVYRDTRPPVVPAPSVDPDSQTHDIDVSADTPVTYGAFASGYGARATIVGGLHSTALGNFASILQPGQVTNQMCAAAPDPRLCFGAPNPSDGSRTFVFGQVQGVEVSSSSVNAHATSFAIDDGTRSDESAFGNFNPADDLWNRIVPPGSGASPSSVTGPITSGAIQQTSVAPADCSNLSSDSATNSSSGADVLCDSQGQTAGADSASPTSLANGAVQVGYAGSATKVHYLTDANTTVTQAVAVARNIQLAIPGGPSLSIGEVRTTATSVAAGRPSTASSKFERTVSNVVVRDPSGTAVFSCGFHGAEETECDPRQLTDAMSAQSPSPIVFRMPEPDSTSAGTPAGAEAEVIKSKYQYWNDYFTDADNSVEIPGLQIVLIGDQDQPSRLVLSLAGVHVESHDAIGLPPPPIPPLPDPTLKLSLTDGSTPAVPLAGGAFALVADDGTTAATCSTAADGIGSCSFPDVKPGNYTIKETTAPPGYAAAPDYKLSLDPGQDYTAAFVNLLAIGAVHVALTSAVDKKPLSGAVFAMYAGSSTLGSPLDTCTTGRDGSCGFDKVPLGAYTMHQQSAPKGFLGTDDFAFTLSDPGQDATLTFVDGTPAVKAEAGKFIPGKPAVPPHTEVVGGGGMGVPAVPAAYSTNSVPPIVSSAPSAQPPVVAGLPQRLANLPAQLAKLLTHSPQQAVLLLFMWLVFGLPIYLWTRRRQLLVATEGT